jgi:hypothetical protein
MQVVVVEVLATVLLVAQAVQVVAVQVLLDKVTEQEELLTQAAAAVALDILVPTQLQDQQAVQVLLYFVTQKHR